ncbi:hypothetical protein [Pseudobutyrivibrio sp. UC1225]|uniref:hypothetical protein n=1 Tax=Pseudobutyrivibrio sp. UC1225 TaxID=1798185 RepID=UPI000B8750FE
MSKYKLRRFTLLDKLEKKFGKYAIPNLIVYLLIGYVIGYLLQFGQKYTGVPYLNYLTLEPHYILRGQIWRLVSWIIIPPDTSFIWAIIMFMLYYQLGSSLENTWGSFRFNVYIFGGMLFTIIGAFITYAIYGPTVPIGQFISTYYINLSIFLAFSTCFPDMQVMLYFIIPVKMKWMSIFYLVIVGYSIVSYLMAGYLFAAMPIIASLLNWFIFFMMTRNLQRYNPKDIHRRAEFRRQATPPRTQYRDGTPIARHKCAVCGRTEISNPELEFRFCSKCNGNYEYCSEHLFTHQHIQH